MHMYVHSGVHTCILYMHEIFFHISIFNIYVFHRPIYVCMHKRVHLSIRMYVCGCIYNHGHVYMCICMYTHHMHMHMYMYKYVCRYIHTSYFFEKTCCLLTHIHSYFLKPRTFYCIATVQLLKSGY